MKKNKKEKENVAAFLQESAALAAASLTGSAADSAPSSIFPAPEAPEMAEQSPRPSRDGLSSVVIKSLPDEIIDYDEKPKHLHCLLRPRLHAAAQDLAKRRGLTLTRLCVLLLEAAVRTDSESRS